jgi:hypothetical protein
MLKYKSIAGQRGTWWVTVTFNDGTKEKLACVHDEYRCGPGKLQYFDSIPPDLRTGKKYLDQIALMQEKKRVVFTSDKKFPQNDRGHNRFQRTDYTGIYNIADLVIDETGTRFEIADRIYKGSMTPTTSLGRCPIAGPPQSPDRLCLINPLLTRAGAFASTSDRRIYKCFEGLSRAPGRIRTSDPQIRSLVLYPAELRALIAETRAAPNGADGHS